MNLPSMPVGAVALVLVKWSLLLALGWIMQGVLQRRHARWRLILWRTLLCSSIALPFLASVRLPAFEIPASPSILINEPTVPLPSEGVRPKSLPSHSDQNVESKPVTISARVPSRSADFQALRLTPAHGLLVVWLLGVACAGLRLFRGYAQLSRVRREAQPADPRLQSLADKIRGELGVRAHVSIVFSRSVTSPFVCGIFRPAIVLPDSLDLPAAEMTALLRHEIAHLLRHDLCWNLGWRWMLALAWFHPLVWGIPRAHNLAAEQEADRVASGQSHDPAAYAQVLANLALRVMAVPSGQSDLALHATSHLVRRLRHLTTGTTGPWTPTKSLGAYGLSALLLILASGWNLAQSKAAAGAPATAERTYRDLLITVEDEASQPVAGALVQPYAFRVKGPRSVDHYGWDRSMRPKLVTDAKGQVRLRYPVEAFPTEKLLTGQISVTVEHSDFGPATGHVPVEGPAEPIHLIRGMVLVISGVAGPDAQPVSALAASLSGEPRIEWKKTTDQILTCRQITPGTYMLQLMGRLPSGEVVYSDVVDFSVQRAEGDTLRIGDSVVSVQKGKPMHLSLSMRKGIRLEGRLDAKVARPVQNGRVIIAVRPKQFPAYVVPEEGADLFSKYGRFDFWTSYRPIAEDGSFVLESIPQGEVDVLVHGEGFVSKNGGRPYNLVSGASSPLVIGVPQAFALAEPVTRIEVATEASATLDVTVKTKSGEPLAGATVSTWPNVMRLQTGIFGGIHRSSESEFQPVQALSESPPDYSQTTDRNGHALLRNIPAVARTLEIEHPQYEVPLPKGTKGMVDRSIRFQLSPGKVEKLTITLQRKGTDHIGDAK